MQEISNILEAVSAVYTAFSNDFGYMDFLFLNRHGSKRTVINAIRSLPGMLIRLDDEHSPDIAFESTWNPKSNRTNNEGWQKHVQPKRAALSHVFAKIRYVRELSICDSSFEIRSANNLDLIGVKSRAMTDSSVDYLQSIVGETFAGLSFKNGDEEILKSWRHQGDAFMEGFQKRLLNQDTSEVKVGQNSRKLLLDADI